MTPKDLLEKAKTRQLSSMEIASVGEELSSSVEGSDKYTLIHILGRAGALAYESEVARYLQYETDPMVARIALQVLCSHWNKARNYLDDIEKFVRGVAWDEDEDVRLAAISIAGELARDQECVFVPLLIQIYSDDHENQIVRQATYFALARASGLDWVELPPASRQMDLLREADQRVLDWIKKQGN